jgi:hypothetical protein
MTLRTFKQYGKAFGTEQLSLIASLDGVEIFNGLIPTSDNEAAVDMSTMTWPYGDVLFTWTEDIEFAGTKEMQIQLHGQGYLMLTSTNANYVCIAETDPFHTTIPGSAEFFNGFYSQKFDGYEAHDPYTNVVIDGKPCNPNDTGETRGQWTWIVHGGSEFVATLNVNKAAYWA